ncbi:tetratricopeptide repeat protein [Cohnella thailandensis]|uniref:Tetratricopeptide repeat protein n=1 Tax=Cohnella thailandensis TaxID=557557 RepID=A0A841T1S1_9BACL|nr:tetratricopeptide repeat protein [Cohnella thailandensis]MBB6636999.1 tetratricopeptide repeat protein [Cohnella thailandensis]MBP1973117.1 tetratricopeptide (TPR) repeat protein [Cohnella thailandensis]
MTEDDRLIYAKLLHEQDRMDEAVRILSELIALSNRTDALLERALVYNDTGREQEAIRDLDEAIRQEPEEYIYWYTRAISYSNLRKYEEAAASMEMALERSGEESRSSTGYELACICLRLERIDRAIQLLEQVAGQEKTLIPLHLYRLSEALESSGRESEALAELRKAVRMQSRLRLSKDGGAEFLKERTRYSDTAIQTLMAIVDSEYGFRMKESQLLEKAGYLEEAFATIEQGLKEYPGEELLLIRQGVLLRQLGREEEAIALLSRLTEADPDNFSARMELILTYRRQERWEQAVDILEDTLKRNPGQTVVRYWLVDVLRDSGKLHEANTASSALTEAEPEDPLNWKQRAELFIDMEQYEEADRAYTKAIALDGSADYYMRRSFSRYMARHYEAAMLDIQEAIAIEPSLREDGKTAYALAELYAGMKNFALADEEYSRAIRLEDDNPHLYERRAAARMNAKSYSAAIEDCRAGLALVPEQTRLIWMKSYLHWELGEYEPALQEALHYVRLVPDDEQGLLNLSTIYSNLRRYDEAIEAINRAIALQPFASRLYLERASLYYHHRFDRSRAADDLVDWLLYAAAERSREDPLSLLDELDGFDDEMRGRAREQYSSGFGASRYLI